MIILKQPFEKLKVYNLRVGFDDGYWYFKQACFVWVVYVVGFYLSEIDAALSKLTSPDSYMKIA